MAEANTEGAVSAGYGEGPGWVPVKRAHLIGKDAYLASVAAREAAEAALRGGGGGGAPPPAEQQSGNKRRRGQNKGRSHEDKGLTAGLPGGPSARLCRSLLGRGFECRFGAGACRDGHDVGAYLAQKPPDLPGTCPLWAALGDCPAGVTCRWHGSHPAAGAGAAAGEAPPPPPPRSINVLSVAVQRALQRGSYGFVLDEEGGTESWAPGAAAGGGGAGGGGSEGPPPASIRASLGAARAAALERPPLRLAGAVVIAPLTTVGNLPFRRVMKRLGADVTIGEMAVASNLCGGQQSEWALLRRHPCEDVFGVQLAGSRPWEFAQVGEVMAREGFEVDFVDINCGCPLDLVCNKGMGAAAMGKVRRGAGARCRACALFACSHPPPRKSNPPPFLPRSWASCATAWLRWTARWACPSP
jgi:tRNA-dihydrouridine synthase 3